MANDTEPMSLAVIGIGNVLMGDDGAGVRVLELLPDHVPKIDLATGGMRLLHKLEGLTTAIIVDAVDFGGKPGEVTVFLPEMVNSLKNTGYSLHDIDILKVIELAKELGQCPNNLFIVAVQPSRMGYSEGLSPEVEAALPKMASEIMVLVNLKELYN